LASHESASARDSQLREPQAPESLTMKRMNRTTLALIAIVGAGALAPQQAQAQDGDHERKDGWEFELGAGAFYVPQYEGSKDYRVQPLPWLSARYTSGDRYVELNGPGLRANVVSGGAFEFGPVLSFEMDRDNSDIDNAAVRRLPEIDGALMAGVFAETGIDLGQGSGLDFSVEALTDIGGVSDGTTAKFEVGYRRPLNERLMGMVGLSTNWTDDNYAQTYSGVTPAGSLASGLPVYTADGGIQNVELSTGLFYQVTERWSMFGMVSYRRLLGSAAESPLVTHGGSENQGGFALAIVRKF
jgi:outer membrane scaffolding protein for murein synthesis (MipA/OmpV family)